MSVRVTDPSGVEWEVSREWMSKPRWKDELTGYPVDLPDVDLADVDLGGDGEAG